MKRLLIFLLIICPLSCASEYNVDTSLYNFVVREGEVVSIDLNVVPSNAEWIIDSSGNSSMYSDKRRSQASMSIYYHVKIKNTGLITLGPYVVKIGNESIKSNPIKIYALPKFDGSEAFVVESYADPNEKNLFQIRIDYEFPEDITSDNFISINNRSFPKSTQPISGNATFEGKIGIWSFTFKVKSNEPYKLTRKNFINLPESYILPDIIIPAKSDLSPKKSL